MEEKKFCDVIVELRKSQGLTQQDLAKKLNITDKAVSKWERGLSYPDITSISTLASALNVESSYLIDLCKKDDSTNPYADKEDSAQLFNLICNGLGVAMSVAVIVLSIIDKLEIKDALTMLAIGLFAISLSLLSKKQEDKKDK